MSMDSPEKKYPRPDDKLGPVEKDPATSSEESFVAEAFLRVLESEAAGDEKNLQKSQSAFEAAGGTIRPGKGKREILLRDRAFRREEAKGGSAVADRRGKRSSEYVFEGDTVSFGDLTDALLDTRRAVTIIVDRGSPGEVFYRILASECGVSVHEEVQDRAGNTLNGKVAFEVLPRGIDRGLIARLFAHNRVIQFLNAPQDLLLMPPGKDFGRKLEQGGLLAEGTAARFLAAVYERAMRQAEQRNTEEDRLLAKAYRARLQKDGIPPMPQDELRALLKKEVGRELELFRKDLRQKGL